MTTNLGAITFSCQDPHKVAEFWAHALGRDIAATADSGSAAILAAIPLYFRRSTSETTVENNIHLDLTTDDLDADATRLRELGATRSVATSGTPPNRSPSSTSRETSST